MPDARHNHPLATFGTPAPLSPLKQREADLIRQYNALPDNAPGETADELLERIAVLQAVKVQTSNMKKRGGG